MTTCTICGVLVKIKGEMTVEEAKEYVNRVPHTDPNTAAVLKRLEIEVDGEYVNLTYHYVAEPFHRIRRITGYLVGNLSRFNDAKLAEVKDRTKHGV